jgi:hypothetical protein
MVSEVLEVLIQAEHHGRECMVEESEDAQEEKDKKRPGSKYVCQK